MRPISHATWIKFLTHEFEEPYIQTSAYAANIHKPVHGSYSGLSRKCCCSIISDLAQMLMWVNLCLTNITMIVLHSVQTCCRSPGAVQVWDSALSVESASGREKWARLNYLVNSVAKVCEGCIWNVTEGVCQVWLQALGCEADRQLQMPVMASEQSGRRGRSRFQFKINLYGLGTSKWPYREHCQPGSQFPVEMAISLM